MFFHVLATDYDGTIAEDGGVAEDTFEALRRLRASGRRLVLVTGRELEDLQRVCPHLEVFDEVVVENGAVIFRPSTKELVLLGDAPPDVFLERLRERGVSPLSVGHVIVATWEPNQDIVLQTIKELGLELQIIFNKGAVMVLPPGINKASGLRAALSKLSIAPINTVGVGDAENDHALLRACGCAVAMANAVPMLKENSDWVTIHSRGQGVVELVEQLLKDDLSAIVRSERHAVSLGELDNLDAKQAGAGALFASDPGRMLICGTSGSGKSTFTQGLLERLSAAGMQFCIIDPEGDYEDLADVTTVGDPQRLPSLDSALEALEFPDRNVVINLLAISLADRPAFLSSLIPRLSDLRARTGRPHWVVIDEAHHMLPAENEAISPRLPADFDHVIYVTVHSGHLAKSALSGARWLVVLGDDIADSVASFADAVGETVPPSIPASVETGRALVWPVGQHRSPFEVKVVPPTDEHRRHLRKYATGTLGEDRSFYFRGPENALNLRAQNLEMFCQIGDGVDNDTWLHHLVAKDYSTWLRDCIKDSELADEIERIELAADGDIDVIRGNVRAAIEKRYTKAA